MPVAATMTATIAKPPPTRRVPVRIEHGVPPVSVGAVAPSLVHDARRTALDRPVGLSPQQYEQSSALSTAAPAELPPSRAPVRFPERLTQRSTVPRVADGLRVTGTCAIPLDELEWRFSGSGGPGRPAREHREHPGRAALRRRRGPVARRHERARLLERLGPVVRVVASDTRSQARNRELALGRLRARLADALRRPRAAPADGAVSRGRRRRVDAEAAAGERQAPAPRADTGRVELAPWTPWSTSPGSLAVRCSCLALDSAVRTFVLPRGSVVPSTRLVFSRSAASSTPAPLRQDLRGPRPRHGALRAAVPADPARDLVGARHRRRSW